MKSLQCAGLWWFPSREEQKIAGTVLFEEREQPKLVLQGRLSQGREPWEMAGTAVPVIWGITDAGEPMTLVHCLVTQEHLDFLSDQGGDQQWVAELLFVGAHFANPEQVVFHRIEAHYTYLPQWAGIFPYRGWQTPFEEEVRALTSRGTISVHFLKSVWERLTSERELIAESDLPDVVSLRFEVLEAVSLEMWMSRFVLPLQHLISLATQRPNALVRLVGYSATSGAEQSESVGEAIPIDIVFSPAILSIAAQKPLAPRDILLPLRELVPRFGAFIEAWLYLAEEVESAFRLFFGSLSTDLPLDLHFLLLAQAIEAYQDVRFDKRPLTEEEFQHVKEVLLAACPEERRPWLENVLAYSNETTFSQQVRNFIGRTNAVLNPLVGKTSKERNTMGERVNATRNYLTHHTKELASQSAHQIELLYITKSLSLALQSCLLLDVGLAKDDVIRAMRKHKDFRLLSFLQSQVYLERPSASDRETTL